MVNVLKKATSLASKNKYDEALKLVENELKRKPNDFDLNYFKAYLLIKQGDTIKSIDNILIAEKTAPNDLKRAYVKYYKAFFYSKIQEINKAKDIYRELDKYFSDQKKWFWVGKVNYSIALLEENNKNEVYRILDNAEYNFKKVKDYNGLFQVQIKRVLLLQGENKLDDAIKHINQIKEKNISKINLIELLDKKARLNILLNHYEQALADIEKALLNKKFTNKKGIAILLRLKLDILVKLEKLKEALPITNELIKYYDEIKLYARKIIYLRRKTTILQRLGNYEEALKAINETIVELDSACQYYEKKNETSGKVDILSLKTDILTGKNKFDEAIQTVNEAIELCLTIKEKKKNADLISKRGYIYYEWGKNNKAIKDHDKAIKLYSELGKNTLKGNTFVDKGLVYCKQRRYIEALKVFNKAMEMFENKKDKVMCLCAMGYAHSELKGFEDALNIFDKAISICTKKDELTKIYFLKGMVYNELNQYEKAIEAFKISEVLRPVHWKNKQPEIESAKVYYLMSDYNECLGILNKVIKCDISNNLKSEINILRGRIYLCKGNFDKAVLLFDAANSQNPKSIETSLWLLYSKYLKANFYEKYKCEKTNVYKYHMEEKQLALVALELEKIINTFKVVCKPQIMAEMYYWLGTMYYKLDDIMKARVCLEKACGKYEENNYQYDGLQHIVCLLIFNFKYAVIEIKSIAKNYLFGYGDAKHLLHIIWNYNIRPSWWSWWFFSPKYLTRNWKITVGGILCMSLLLQCGYILLHVLKNAPFYIYPQTTGLFSVLSAIIAFILLSPLLNRFKAGKIEIEIASPVLFPGSNPVTMESMLNDIRDKIKTRNVNTV